MENKIFRFRNTMTDGFPVATPGKTHRGSSEESFVCLKESVLQIGGKSLFTVVNTNVTVISTKYDDHLFNITFVFNKTK